MGLSKIMRAAVSKTKIVFRFLKKTQQSKQRVQYSTEASSHEDVWFARLQEKDFQDYVEDFQKVLKEATSKPAPEGLVFVPSQKEENIFQEAVGHQETYLSESQHGFQENVGGWIEAVSDGLEGANVVKMPEVEVTLEMVWLSQFEVTAPYCLMTSWLMTLSLSFHVPSCCDVKCSICFLFCCTTGNPFQKKQTQAVKGGDSLEVQESGSCLVEMSVPKDKATQSYSGPGLSASASSSDADRKQTESGPSDKELPFVTAPGGAGEKTSAGQQSPEAQNQSSTLARKSVTSQCRNGGGSRSGACGGTGGEEPPDDRPWKKLLPQDTPDEEQEQEDETSTKIPMNDHNKKMLTTFLEDDHRANTGFYLCDQPPTTASPGKKYRSRRGGGAFLPSSKPEHWQNRSTATNVGHSTASPPGLVNLAQEQKSRDVPEEFRRESSGRGSRLSETDRIYFAMLKDDLLKAAQKEEDPLKMEELMVIALELPDGNEDHDPGGEGV